MLYYGPEDFTPFWAHADRFGGQFGCLEPSGGFVYSINSKSLNLSDETEEKLLELIEQSKAEGKDLVYEAYKDKAFDPYPDPDADY